MRKYELVCILDPQVGDGRFDEVVERYENYLKSNGAEIAHIDRWGMRKLAYTSPSLKKRSQGYYVLFQFESESGLIAPMESEMLIDEAVLRHLIVAIDGEFMRVPELAPESILDPPPPRGPRDRGGRPGGRPDRGEGGRFSRDREERRPPRADASEAKSAEGSGDADKGDKGDDGEKTEA
jgi:small subunit ribosomal protein S6